jgi:hypothetical protein
LELGYGAGWTPLDRLILNFSVTTARFRRTYGIIYPPDYEIVVLHKGRYNQIYFDYGFSFDYSYYKKLKPAVAISGSGNIFFRAFHRKKMEMDLYGDVAIHLYRYIRVKVKMSLKYDPVYSYKLQYRNEFTAGFYISNE